MHKRPAVFGLRKFVLCTISFLPIQMAGCDTSADRRDFRGFALPFNLSSESLATFPDQSELDEPLFDDIPGAAGHHAATIAAFPDGELIAAWYSYRGPEELDGAAIYTSRRRPDASAWSQPRLEIARGDPVGNPVLFAEGEDLLLFFAVAPFGWSSAHIEMQRSSDRGMTWSSPIRLPGPIGSNVRFPPIRLHDGRLLLPAYDDLFHRTMFLTSNDGESWELMPIVSSGENGKPIQPSVVELAGGRLLAVMRNTAKGWLWVMASDDMALSWSPPADSGFPNPGSAAALHRLASGHLVLVYNDSPRERRPLTVALSTDEGKTWPNRMILADGDETYSYPSITQSPDGMIHIVYSLARRSIRHVAIDADSIGR
ncbi:MAG: exo-alpha-sialidase [Planctomycetes bacterium]|nr:exo-alpha-sialidase [Planctomycetota bacterium]